MYEFCMSFDKKTSGGKIKSEIISNKALTEELQEPIMRKLKKEKHTHLL